MTHKDVTPGTTITIQLPAPPVADSDGAARLASLLIQRGDLGQVRRFHYDGTTATLAEAIDAALSALDGIEAAPPEIPDLPVETKRKTRRKATASKAPVADSEPTIDVPLKQGTQRVKMSAIKIVSGDSDAAAYRQAIMLAGRLIDGKLWDGITPLRFENVYGVAQQMKHLDDKDFSLFTLDDFVQSGTVDTDATTEREHHETALADKTGVADSPASTTKQAFYELLGDAELAEAIFADIQQKKQHGWQGNLIKERMVKAIIAPFVDGKAETVEALFEIAVTAPEFATVQEDTPAEILAEDPGTEDSSLPQRTLL